MTITNVSPQRRARVCTAMTSAVIGLALAAPTGASAASARATVLLRVGHNVELVGAGHLVRGYHYGSGLPAVGFGNELAYRSRGSRLTHVHVLAGRAAKVSFYARVNSTSAGGGLAIQLADGRRLSFAASHVTESGAGPKPGQTVMVTLGRAGHGLHVVVSRSSGSSGHHTGGQQGPGKKGTGPKGSTGSTGPTGPTGLTGSHPIEPHSDADGVVTNLGSDSITLQLPDGSTLTPTLPAASLAYLTNNVDIADCETVQVAYSGSATAPVLDSLAATGISVAPISESLGDTCADESDGGIDVVGTITALSATSLTMSVPGQGSMSFTADPSLDLPDSNEVGDLVDVMYTQNPDGSRTVQTVGYVEQYATGTILAVDNDAGTLSIADAVTGQTDTFQQSDADFSNLTTGESVGVDYFGYGGQLQADDVESLAAR
jgi:hypothetical protein